MSAWSLQNLQDEICRTRSDKVELLEMVRSIDSYIKIFRFHVVGARDAMDGVVDPVNPGHESHLDFVFGISEKQDEFYLAKIASEAHTLGCIHSSRSIFDVFAFLVNRLLLNNAIPPERCNISILARKLKPSPLREDLESLIDSYWFKYVSAFINTANRLLKNPLPAVSPHPQNTI